MKPHIHAAVINAFADGAEIQVMTSGEWRDCKYPDFEPGCGYRIKPVAPKWPQTTMTDEQMKAAANSAPLGKTVRYVANAAIAHACETGALVPADKVREIEAKARAEGKREGLPPVAVIQAVVDHMRLGSIDADTIQIILLEAAAL